MPNRWMSLGSGIKPYPAALCCQGDEALFMETALALGDPRSHAAVEALPLPPKAASKVHPAPLRWLS